MTRGVDGFGERFEGRSAIAGVVLDAEVTEWATLIVAGRQDDAAECPLLADDRRHGRRGQQSVLTDEYSTKPGGGRHLDDGLGGNVIVEAAVATNDQRLTIKALQRGKDRRHEVFQVVRLLEYRHLLAKSGRAGSLTGKWCGGHLANDRCRDERLVQRQVAAGRQIPAHVTPHRPLHGPGPCCRLVPKGEHSMQRAFHRIRSDRRKYKPRRHTVGERRFVGIYDGVGQTTHTRHKRQRAVAKAAQLGESARLETGWHHHNVGTRLHAMGQAFVEPRDKRQSTGVGRGRRGVCRFQHRVAAAQDRQLTACDDLRQAGQNEVETLLL